MRLAAQMRGGFYPAPPEAVAYAATYLRAPQHLPFAILDPCAGEGAALRQLGELLGCPLSSTFAIELDDSRAQKLLANLPEAHVLAPASYFGCRASGNSFSFIWLNPPFESSYGGCRVEEQFLTTATDWLMPGGVLALICPEDVVGEFSEVRRHFATYYEQCTLVQFPESQRHFQEIMVFGHKRRRPSGESWVVRSWPLVQAPSGFVYHIPTGSGPRVFQKVQPTEPELQTMLARSPLRAHLTTSPETSLPSPPLALGIGHVALLLASGHLDGVVHPEGQAPHVVRGTSRKREFVADVIETANPDGGVTKRTTLSERIELIVRTVDRSGAIHTYMDTDARDS